MRSRILRAGVSSRPKHRLGVDGSPGDPARRTGLQGDLAQNAGVGAPAALQARQFARPAASVHPDHQQMVLPPTGLLAHIALERQEWVRMLACAFPVQPDAGMMVDALKAERHPLTAPSSRYRKPASIPADSLVGRQSRCTQIHGAVNRDLPPVVRVEVGAMEVEEFTLVEGVRLEAPQATEIDGFAHGW